jgi:hypothetical protein
MILVRNVFRVKFGQSKDAVAAMKENIELMKKSGFGGAQPRLLTDLVGPFYTVVLEMTFDSLADWETTMKTSMGGEEWKAVYAKFTALTEEGYREIFTIVS